MKTGTTLRAWLRKFWLVILFILVIEYVFSQALLIQFLLKRTERNLQQSIELAQQSIEDSLNMIDSCIYEGLYNSDVNAPAQLYQILAENQEGPELSAAKKTIVDSLSSILYWSDKIDFILVYTDQQGEDQWLEVGREKNYTSRNRVKVLFKEKLESHSGEFGRYMILQDDTENYMLRVLKIVDSYIIVGVSEDEMLEILSEAAYDADTGIVFVTEEDGTVIFSSAEIGDILQTEADGSYITLNGESWLQMGIESESTGYYMGILTNRKTIYKELSFVGYVFCFILAALLILVPYSMFILKNKLEKPVENLAETMRNAGTENDSVKADNPMAVEELVILTNTYNEMIDHIRELKIENYESQMEAQRATMQYLQMQIKPHFYANVINIIYALAEQKDYATIQKLSKAIISYSRYMFRDATELVELKKELEHVKYYMEIQEIRYLRHIEWEAETDAAAEDALVPPFVSQSFVENSVKYAFSTQKLCKISIRAVLAGDEKLQIQIRDNGKGYAQEIINHKWDEKNESGHIGLTNIYKRLRLIYGDSAKIRLENQEGAMTTITIPYISAQPDLDLYDAEID